MKTGENVKKPKRRVSVFTIAMIVLLVAVVGTIAFNIATNKNAVEADHVLTRDALNSENVVNYGTTTDGDYAFSLRANESTTIELWGYNGTIIENNNPQIYPETQGYAIMPTDDSLSGKIGCWFRNVGSYNGKTINLKCTYYWYPLKADGKAIHPYIEADVEDVNTNNKEGKIGFNFSNNSIKVKFDLYEEGDDENPVAVNMSLTFGDIDGTQYYGFRMNENGGTINKIQCPSDATTFFKKMVSQNAADENKEFYWIYSDATTWEDTLNATVRFELKDASSFTIIYGSELDHKSHTFLGRSVATNTERDHSDELVYNRYASLKQQFDSKKLWPATANTADDGNTYLFTNDCRYWGYFNGFAYGPYTLPDPTKLVSDNNEKKKTSNTLESDTENLIYSISQGVPTEHQEYYYNSFAIIDTLPNCVTYKSAKVLNDARKDVSANFDITTTTQDGRTTVTATAKASFLSQVKFYNNEYTLQITTNLADNPQSKSDFVKNGSDYKFKFTNKASTRVVRSGETVTKQTKEVTTYYQIRRIIGTVFEDANINGKIDNNETVFKDITVRLLDKDSNPAKDVNGNEFAAIKTDANGKYEFTKVKQGEYIVEFTFGNDKKTTYVATEKELVNDININSRINTINTTTGIAVTDTLTGLNTKDAVLEVANAGIYKKPEKSVKIVGDENKTSVHEGDILEYSVKYTNKTDANEKVEIIDDIPAQTTFVNGSVKVTIGGKDALSNVTVTTPTTAKNVVDIVTKGQIVKPNEEIVLTYRVTVGKLETNKITNTAEVKKNDGKAIPTNEVITPVEELPVKSVNPTSGTTVKQGQNLVYTITYKNITSADETVTVKDAVPEGTKYVGNVTAKINGTDVQATVTEPQKNANTGDIIVSPNVKLKDGETLTVSFTVKVRTLAEGLDVDIIKNDAIVEHYSDPAKPSTPKTNEVENPVENKPIKSVEPATGTHVKEGEILTYTIEYTNLSEKAQQIIITDEVPEGTKYVGDVTVAIDGESVIENMKVTEPEVGAGEGKLEAKTDDTLTLKHGEKITLTFKVQVKTVKEGLKLNKVTNIGYVQNDPNAKPIPTNIVENPVDTVPSKDVDVGNLTGVRSGDTLEYSVTYTNLDEESKTIKVMDEVPEGTKYVGEITAKIDGKDILKDVSIVEPKAGADKGDIIVATKDGVVLRQNETMVVTFKVQVKTEKEGLKINNITNTAEVEHTGIVTKTPVTDETNEVENPVNNPKKDVDVGNGKSVKQGDILTYSVTYKNFGKIGETIKITDALPEGTIYVGGETATIEGVDVLSTGDVKVAFVNNQVVFETAENVLLEKDETIEVTFKVKVKTTEEGLNVDEIINVADVEHNGKVERTNEVINPVSARIINTSDINLWIYIAIAVVAIIGIVTGVVVIGKNKKKK